MQRSVFIARLGLLFYFPALCVHAQVLSVEPLLDVEGLREAPVVEAMKPTLKFDGTQGVAALSDGNTALPKTPSATGAAATPPSVTLSAPSSLHPKEVVPPQRAIRMEVTRYRVLGVDSAMATRLEAVLDSHQGEGKTHEDLSQAANLLTRHLQASEGLYLAYAYLPEQPLQHGEVLIQVLPGELAEVKLEGAESEALRAQVLRVLSQLEPGKPLYTADLERASFLLNDLPGWRFDFGMQPGPRVGSAILLVKVYAEAQAMGYLGWDNQGSRAIGHERVRAALRWSPSWVPGDALSVSGLKTLSDEVSFAAVHYSLPLGSAGWRVGWAYSDLAYDLNPTATQAQQTGDAQTWSLHALYPWVRARHHNLYGLFQFQHGSYSDHMANGSVQNEKNLDSLEFTLSGDWRDYVGAGAINSAELGLRASVLDVRQTAATQASEADSLNWRLTYNVSRLQNLVPERMQAWWSLRGQESTRSLDSVEHCALGGATALRAFAQGEAEGHSCTVLTAELRFLLPQALMMPGLRDASLSLFQDWGRVRNTVSTEFLSGHGLALQVAVGEGKATPWTAQVVWAAPVHEGSATAAYESRRLQGSLRMQF